MASKLVGLRVRCSVPYPTKWGQSVRLIGEGTALGEWAPSRGVPLECKHVDDALLWTCTLTLPKAGELQYKYVVVNEGGAVEDSETRPRTVQLPADLPPGAAVVLADEWQVGLCFLKVGTKYASYKFTFGGLLLSHGTTLQLQRGQNHLYRTS